MDRPTIYARNNAQQQRDNIYTLDTYFHLVRWKKFPRILDLGCGDGTTTREVLEPRVTRDYTKLVGSDLQENMVKYARATNNNSRLDFVQFDIAGDKLLPETNDHIFSFFAFHWVTDLRKGFRNIYDLLTPGGDMLINLVIGSPFFHVLKRQLADPIWSPYFKNYTLSPIKRCHNPERIIKTHLKENGFTDIKLYIEEKDFLYNNWAHCLKSFLALHPIISKLEEDIKAECIVDLFLALKEISGKCEDPNGKISMPYKLLIVYASKPSKGL